VSATGDCAITMPAGTVSLDTAVTAPTARPTASISIVASSCVMPTTAGAATPGRPDETTIATALPAVT